MLLQLIRKVFSKTKPRQTAEAREEALQTSIRHAISIADAGDLDAAIAAYEKILADEPESWLALHGMALLSVRKGRHAQAYAIAKELTERLPGMPEAWTVRALSGRGLGLLDDALEAANRSIALKQDPAMISCAGVLLFHLGRVDEAILTFEKALTLVPDDDSIHSNRLFALTCKSGIARDELVREHLAWGRQIEARIKPLEMEFSNPLTAGRRLRIGYVSADLRMHPVATLLEPILQQHDKSCFEIFCYDCQAGEGDAITRRLIALADHWIACGLADDALLAKRIQDDQIDILVDLSGHTAGNRLPLFALRPAPVQASWFGYMSTTGLTRIDYRLSDWGLCPPGSENAYSEKIVRLPVAVAWAPYPQSPALNPLPADINGYVTFGSFNNWSKVTSGAIACWSNILVRCANSRMRIIAPGGETDSVKATIQASFTAHGVQEDRLLISGTTSLENFLKVVQEADIALDPFPYNGGTTSFHCFWMGVPIVSLVSEDELGRAGHGLLQSVGLGDLCANSEADYVDIACALAAARPRLRNLRQSLRNSLSGTAIMDARAVTLEVEKAYRTMWHNWIDKRSVHGSEG